MNAAFLAPAITLFNDDGTLDLVSQERLYDNLIDNGIDGILVEGSSSEFFAMNMDQRREMAKFAIEKVNHRVKLIIGTTSMVASDISDFSNFCLDAGADAVMILPPYYFHFGPEALLQYYDRLAKEIHGPIYIYNFPDNTGYTIPVETVLQLALMHPNIVGLKDTIPGMDHTRELIKTVKSRVPNFEVYSGFDDNFARNILSGGNGCIAALSNLAPEITSAWVRAFRENDLNGIALGQQRIDRLMDMYRIRDPFLPVLKEAIKLRGIAASSTSTFPMPNATIEDDARILELLSKENLR
ncbi:MAG: dihydrodipicolinate synthase family protein [Oscillibacter sp.]|nr:dihydrodipicolinate synthase family protein [Oscillibacter sp.]